MALAQMSIPYGQGKSLNLQVDEARLVGVASLNPTPPVNVVEVLEEALAAPVDVPPLRQLVRPGERVTIVCDDLTRPTPCDRLLPGIVDKLTAGGVQEENITVLIATGSHRPMTQEEIRQKIGSGMADRVRVVNHDYQNREELVYLGDTTGGIPVWVNRLVLESDLVIGVGNIVPHRYCGWSGGGKIIQPGVCGEETTIATHLMITEDASIRLGNLDNPVREEIDRVAQMAGLRFIVNTVLNAQQEVMGVVAGDPVAAHRKGVKLAAVVYGVTLPDKAEIVVASSYPADLNFWQAGKALYAAELVVREGGTIILVTPAWEGGGEHPEFLTLLGKSYEEIKQELHQGRVQDRIAAAGALAVSLVREKASIAIVSDGLTDQDVSAMGMARYAPEQLQSVVDAAVARYGDNCHLSILREGAELLPIVARE